MFKANNLILLIVKFQNRFGKIYKLIVIILLRLQSSLRRTRLTIVSTQDNIAACKVAVHRFVTLRSTS